MSLTIKIDVKLIQYEEFIKANAKKNLIKQIFFF